MNLRDLAAGAARTSAGLWQGVAEAIEPRPTPRAVPDPVDLTDDGPSDRAVGDAVRSGDAMLVPVDSWTRVLEQLGNLHEAGQQLAEARERAAKAETEAAFLRRQLADVRARDQAPVAQPEPEPAAPTVRPSVGGRAADAAARTRRRAAVWFRR